MNNVMSVVRLLLLAAGLAAIAYLGLELKKKWDHEAEQASAPAVVEPGP